MIYDGINRSQLKVKGSFDSESELFSSEKHSIDISSHSTAAAKKVFADIVPVIRQGNSKKPAITEIYDTKSKSAGTLTKGGSLEIKGANIKICGDSENFALYFENTVDSSKTVKLKPDEFGMNTSTRIACVVLLELENGTYSIKVVTQFMNSSSVFRKESQSASYSSFVVA